MKTTTIKQKTITLEFDSQKIVVRRMPWKAARDFLAKLSTHAATLGTNITDVLPKLPEIVRGADELVTDLVINSTDLSAEQLNGLDVAQASAVIEAAIELNLGEELKNSWTGISANLAALMPGRSMMSGASSTPTS